MSRISLTLLATVGCWVLLSLVPSHEATADPKTVCYYESWVHWRKGEGKIDPTDLDSSLCTHMVYSYFGIDAGTHQLKLLDPYLMNDLHDIEKFVNAKGSAKALIAVGGSTMSDQFSLTAQSEGYRTTFVKSVVEFLTQHGFDGVMIDWSAIQEKDSENFVKLLDKFDELFASTSFILGVSLPATVATLNFYNIPKINNFVDFFNIITLDYAGPWNNVVQHASPFSSQLATLEEYHKRGAPRHKLVMAVPMYARTWKLAHNDKQSIGDKASGPGFQGPYTETQGFLSYNELCTLIKNENNAFSIMRDPKETAIYATYIHAGSVEWISFEDTHTLATKAENITREGYGGISVYTLSNEDVHGLCGKKNPLLHAINEHYYRGVVTEVPVITIPPVVHTTEKVTDIPGVFRCHSEGKFRDPVYCFKYYECKQGDFGLESTVFYCDRHQAFDNVSGKCVEHTKVAGC